MLAGVSVFKMEKENAIQAITDSDGQAELLLEENKSYLFHLIGYEDLVLSVNELKRNSTVILAEQISQLKEVAIGKTKYQHVVIRSKQKGFRWGFPSIFKTTVEKVVNIPVTKAGFLKKFSVPIHQKSALPLRKYEFVLYEIDHAGKPGKLLITEVVKGTTLKGKMVFDLIAQNIFLPTGNYFFGFETRFSGAFDANEIKQSGQKEGWIIASTSFDFKALETPVSFRRFNLGHWEKDKTSGGGGIKEYYLNMGYELEMDVIQ